MVAFVGCNCAAQRKVERLMKKIICAALALSLLGSTAAEARDWNGWHGGHGGWHHHGNADWAVGLGLGLFALGVLGAATSAHDHDRGAYYGNHGAPGYDGPGPGYGGQGYGEPGYDGPGPGYDNRGYPDGYGPPPDNGQRHYEEEGGY
jgi:hypothetical protein